jgi:uncharacterized protein YbcI
MGRIAHDEVAGDGEHRWPTGIGKGVYRMASGLFLDDEGRAGQAGSRADSPAGALNAELTRSVVRVYRSFRGRGPTKARALFRDDVVVVMLEDVTTPSERSLTADGRTREVLELRRELHEVMRPALTSVVEGLTGCRVRTVIGASDTTPDVAVEVFMLDGPVDPRRRPGYSSSTTGSPSATRPGRTVEP